MLFRILAWTALAAHLTFILWVILGALFTRRRPWLAAAHIASLVYAILIEVASRPCPLTALEQWAQRKAGLVPYEGDFLAYYLGRIIYPDVPYAVLVPAAVAVCLFNLGIYARRGWRAWKRNAPGPPKTASGAAAQRNTLRNTPAGNSRAGKRGFRPR